MEHEVKFTTTKKEDVLIKACVERYADITKNLSGEGKIDRCSLTMDLIATNANGCPIDFDKLLHMSDFDFIHDIYGIMKKLDRTTGKLKDLFEPRSAR